MFLTVWPTRALKVTVRYSIFSGSKGYFRVHVGHGAGIDGLRFLPCLLVTTFLSVGRTVNKKKRWFTFLLIRTRTKTIINTSQLNVTSRLS